MKICSSCNAEFEYKDGLCRRCFVLRIWRTNTSKDNLGIILFFKAIIPKAFKNFKYGFPDFHREILWEVLRDEPGWNFYNRQIVVAAPRGSSKTTLLSKGLVLYCAAFGLKKYIVIASKTSRAAQKNLRWIRAALGSSAFISFFGDLRPDSRGKRLEVDEIEGVWSKEIVVLKNGVTIEAIGMLQQLRSSTEGEDVNRIDLFIADDTETNENTKTPDRREDNAEWLFETVLPSLDVDTGTIVFINTMTHTDSILANLLKKDSGWRRLFYKISYTGADGKERSLWPEKFSLATLEAIRKNYEIVGRLSSFYKEYYNEVKSEYGFSENWIRRWDGRVFNQSGENWIEVKTDGSENVQILPCYLTIGIDLAFSEKNWSDYTAIVLLAQVPDRRKFVVLYHRGRYSLYDEYDNNLSLLRKGVISEVKRILDEYSVNSVTVDATGTQQGTFYEIKRALQLHRNVMVIPDISRQEKLTKLRDYFQPEYETGRIYHRPWMQELDRELISFGDSTDDLLDAMYLACKNSKPPLPTRYHPIWGREDTEQDISYQEARNRHRILSNVM